MGNSNSQIIQWYNGGGIIQWKANELKDLDRKSRKTITLYGGLHLKNDVDRLYVKRKEEDRRRRFD